MRRAPAPERLTVLGIDPYDARLAAELWRFVPDDADAVYRPRFVTGADRSILAAFARNPPVTLVVLALSGYRRLFRAEEPPALAAVEEVGDGLGPVVVLDVDPLDGVHDQGRWWTVGAWAVVALAAAALAALALAPGPATALLAAVLGPLSASFVLAHGGAQIQYRDRAIFDAVRERAGRCDHDHPVAIVRERHVPGVADRAKDALVATEARAVSTELTADESLY